MPVKGLSSLSEAELLENSGEKVQTINQKWEKEKHGWRGRKILSELQLRRVIMCKKFEVCNAKNMKLKWKLFSINRRNDFPVCFLSARRKMFLGYIFNRLLISQKRPIFIQGVSQGVQDWLTSGRWTTADARTNTKREGAWRNTLKRNSRKSYLIISLGLRQDLPHHLFLAAGSNKYQAWIRKNEGYKLFFCSASWKAHGRKKHWASFNHNSKQSTLNT